MTKKDEEQPRFSARQVILATALEAGNTVKEAAEAAGVSERWAYELLARSEAVVNEIRELVRPVVRVNVREIRRVAAEKAAEEFEERLGAAFDALDVAVVDPKQRMDAVREIFNRSLGKVPTNLQVSGGTKNTLQISFDPATANAVAGYLRENAALHASAREFERALPPVIDVDAND